MKEGERDGERRRKASYVLLFPPTLARHGRSRRVNVSRSIELSGEVDGEIHVGGDDAWIMGRGGNGKIETACWASHDSLRLGHDFVPGLEKTTLGVGSRDCHPRFAGLNRAKIGAESHRSKGRNLHHVFPIPNRHPRTATRAPQASPRVGLSGVGITAVLGVWPNPLISKSAKACLSLPGLFTNGWPRAADVESIPPP